MQYLNGSYTSYFNRRHGRSGHLFQGRYRGHLVEEQGYFLEVSRYLHLNPVRARIVAAPELWPWSSYAGYRMVRKALPWVTYRSVLGEFAWSKAEARVCPLCGRGAGEEDAVAFASAVGGLLVGSAALVERIKTLLGERPTGSALPQLEQLRPRTPIEQMIAAVALHFGMEATGWKPVARGDDASRAVAAYLACRHFGHSAADGATALGYRSHGSVRNALLRIESGNANLLRTVKELYRKLASDRVRSDPS